MKYTPPAVWTKRQNTVCSSSEATIINVHPDADTLAADRYLYIPLGTHRFRGKSYLFLDSKGNPEIQRSYVDHLLFVEK